MSIRSYDWSLSPREPGQGKSLPRKVNGFPDQSLPMSMTMYITVSTMKAKQALHRTKDIDQRFLLIGTKPSSLLKPHRTPAAMPHTAAHIIQRLTLKMGRSNLVRSKYAILLFEQKLRSRATSENVLPVCSFAIGNQNLPSLQPQKGQENRGKTAQEAFRIEWDIAVVDFL